MGLISVLILSISAQGDPYKDLFKVKPKEPEPVDLDETHTSKVFMDIAFDGEFEGRIEIGLFGNTLPKTVENFRALMTGEKGIGPVHGKPLHYKGSRFHKIHDDIYIVGGDIIHGDGSGGESIYGEWFDQEKFGPLEDHFITHTEAFVVGMINNLEELKEADDKY